MNPSAQKELRGINRTLIRQILLYLIDHTDAKDTLEGISGWWLPKCIAEQGEAKVQEAIRSLVQQGWITERKTANNHIYALNPERLQAIKAYLDGSDND